MKSQALRSNAFLPSIVITFGLSAVVSTAMPAGAASISFSPSVWFGYKCISNNSAANCNTGVTQFRTKVSQVSSTQVLFEFFNRASQGGTALASSITEVFFDDTKPYSLDFSAPTNAPIITSSTGVSFSRELNARGKAPNLPGGSSVSFSSNYTAGSNAPVQRNGVNPGESLSILFNVRPGFIDPFNAVITDLQRGSLRVGIHGQGFQNGGSESYVNEAVPEPLTMLGSGLALGLGALLQRKLSRLQSSKS